MKLAMDYNLLRATYGDLEGFAVAKETGFDAIDYGFYDMKDNNWLLREDYLDHAKALRAAMDAAGIQCRQTHAPFNFHYGCAMDESCPEYLETVRAIEASAILGAKYTVIHAVVVPNDVSLHDYNLDFYRTFIPYCEKYGVQVAVENLFYYDQVTKERKGRLAKPEELQGMVKELNSPWFVICVDVGHCVLTWQQPEDFIDAIDGELLKVLHIQDTDDIQDRHTMPYLGDIHWDKLMASLKRNGYDGDLTYEIFKFFKKMPVELRREALAFSEKVGRHLIHLFDEA